MQCWAIPLGSSSSTRFDDDVQVNMYVTVLRTLSDVEIVTLDHNNTENDEDKSEQLTPITLTEAKVSLNKLRNFYLQNHIDWDFIQASFILKISTDKVRLSEGIFTSHCSATDGLQRRIS
ncbi:hypothetical protein TNCV_3558281 [Trichonephila clavipes]|uniref:Uncharacterized protein n=1 Tax=Trichonephila clavipes TaxID=2585209 RepID=A0A8X6WCN1_TRICX|nr:hypothetical protein TNCV_3558281 [Trichonephila clavipes]